MKLIYTLLLISFISCNNPKRDCSNFKTGSFEYEYELDGKNIKATFTRNDTLEIDYNKNSIDSISVRWINDCEYILKTIRPKNIAEKKFIHIKILNTKGNTYTFESKIINDPQKRLSRGTVTKVK